jgi:hypothetical protein
MVKIYPCHSAKSWFSIAVALWFSVTVQAQSAKNPFEAVFETTGIKKESLKGLPNLARVLSNKDYTISDINSWILAYPKEWKAFTELAEIKKLNIAWITLGVKAPAAERKFEHSLYEWYLASGLTDDKRKQLFPHFPLPDLKNDYDKEQLVYEQKIGVWQRLYPEEYERFLNTPELTALNPYYTGYYTLPYLPRFVGQEITLNKPQKASSGNAVMDEYNYQLKLRNWYFVFKPEEFERLYGKDYKFPDSFDAKTYREYIIRVLKETQSGTYPNNQNGH